MKNKLIFLLLVFFQIGICMAEENWRAEISESFTLSKELMARRILPSVEDILSLWEKKRFYEKKFDELEASGGSIRLDQDFQHVYLDFVGNLFQMMSSRESDTRIRELHFREFKECKQDQAWHYILCYLRSAKDKHDAIIELFDARDDVDNEIAKRITRYCSAKKNEHVKPCLRMDEKLLNRLSVFARKYLKTRDKFPENYAMNVLLCSNFIFEGMTEEQFYSRVFPIYMDYIRGSMPKNPKPNGEYFFGTDEYCDLVLSLDFILWWREYIRLPKYPVCTLENLQANTPQEKGFERTSMLALRAKFGDASVKDDLKSGIENLEDITLRAYFLRMFGNIATLDDVPFLKKMREGDVEYTISDLDRETWYPLKRERYPDLKVREKISPLKEAVEEIYKKIGYKE